MSDEFLQSIMKDSARIVNHHDKQINEQAMKHGAVPQNTKIDAGSNTKAYLMEQIENMEQQINHLKQIVGRL